MKAGIRGILLGAFGVNIFMFLMVMEAWGSGLVPDHLPWLIVGSAILCLYGYHQNKDEEEDDADS